MAKKQEAPEVVVPAPAPAVSIDQLAEAFTRAMLAVKPIEKKTAANRKPGDPWQPKDGSKKLKLKRKVYQHGLPIDPDVNDNATIEALNRLKTGRFAGGMIKVYKRKDGGLEIDYPIKTASQKLKIAQLVGGRGLLGLCEMCIEEAKNPKPEFAEDEVD